MANINPKTIGDITYTQEPFWRIITLPIKASTSVVKGRLVTIDGNGRLIAITRVGSVTSNLNGMFQSLVDVVAGTVEDTDFVQVATMGSRMLLKAEGSGLTVGNPVSIEFSSATVVDPESVRKSTARDDPDRVGTIFEIYTRTSSSAKKQVTTAATDLVIIETGMY